MACGTLLAWWFNALETRRPFAVFTFYKVSVATEVWSLFFAWLILVSVCQQPVLHPFWHKPESLFPELYQMCFFRVNNTVIHPSDTCLLGDKKKCIQIFGVENNTLRKSELSWTDTYYLGNLCRWSSPCTCQAFWLPTAVLLPLYQPLVPWIFQGLKMLSSLEGIRG